MFKKLYRVLPRTISVGYFCKSSLQSLKETERFRNETEH
nr:MAG TPA: hypothetical protein [Caudoviricetes sp.]